MSQPVVALSQRLAGVLRFAKGVAGLTRNGDRWRIAITGGSAHEADGIVLALPAYAAGRVLESVGVTHARVLAEVVYVPSITVSLAYRADQIGRALNGAGFVLEPGVVGARHGAPPPMRARRYATQKSPRRAPAG